MVRCHEHTSYVDQRRRVARCELHGGTNDAATCDHVTEAESFDRSDTRTIREEDRSSCRETSTSTPTPTVTPTATNIIIVTVTVTVTVIAADTRTIVMPPVVHHHFVEIHAGLGAVGVAGRMGKGILR